MPPDNEPDKVEQPKVDPAGKVTEKTNEPAKKSYDELQKDYEQVAEIAKSVYQYVKENDDGTREFDVPRMVEDLGYDPTALRKKGEKPPEPKEETIEPEKRKKQMLDEFNKDPEGYMVKQRESLLAEARKEIATSTKPLAEKVRAREIEEMVSTVSNEFDDFQDLQGDIARLARKKPPRDADDLRDLYHAAKGRKQQESGSGLAGSNRGSQRAGKNVPTITAEEQIVNEIMSFAGKANTPESKAAMNLFGKSKLPPI